MIISQLPNSSLLTSPTSTLARLLPGSRPLPSLCFLSFHIVLCFNTSAAGTSLNTAAEPGINGEDITLLCLSSLSSATPLLSPPNFCIYPNSVLSITLPNTVRPERGGRREEDVRLLARCHRHKKVKQKLTKGGHFDEDSVEVR